MSMFTACTRLKFGMKRKQKRYEEQNLQLMCSPVGRFKTVVEEGSSNVQLYQISTQQRHKLYFKERDLKRRSQVTAIPCDMVPSSGIRKSLQYHLDEQNKTNLDHVDEADDVGVIDLPRDENPRHRDLHGDLLDSNHVPSTPPKTIPTRFVVPIDFSEPKKTKNEDEETTKTKRQRRGRERMQKKEKLIIK